MPVLRGRRRVAGFVRVAQQDRAPPSGGGCRRFESCHGRVKEEKMRCHGCGKRMFFKTKDGYHRRCRRRMQKRIRQSGKDLGRRQPPRKEPPYLP